MFPLRPRPRASPDRHRHERSPAQPSANRGRLRDRCRVAGAWRARDPGAQGDQPRRPRRDGRFRACSPVAAGRPRTRRSSPEVWGAFLRAGAEAIELFDLANRRFQVRGPDGRRGDLISIDGSTGEVFPRRGPGQRPGGRPTAGGRGRSKTRSRTRSRGSSTPTAYGARRAGERRHPRGRPVGRRSAPRASACADREHMFLGDRWHSSSG